MRIACLQFAPQVGDVDNNLNRAVGLPLLEQSIDSDSVLSKADPNDLEDLDLLVLPELAFSGYDFKSLRQIAPFLEPSGSGISSLWARTTALRYNTTVVVGYPEKVDVTLSWPTSPEYYNSAIIVDQDGHTIGNYRKSSLYRTDETWALEGRDGFFQGEIPGLGQTAMGICMDLNPYRFEAPWHAFEFAFHILNVRANLVILSMAWSTHEDARMFSRMPAEPDMDTLTYWVQRLEPLIRAENDEETIVVFCNRAGTEGNAVYAGTSAVLSIKQGEVGVYGILGRGVKDLLVVDTNVAPFAKLLHRPDGETTDAEVNVMPAQHTAPRWVEELSAYAQHYEKIRKAQDPITNSDTRIAVSTSPTRYSRNTDRGEPNNCNTNSSKPHAVLPEAEGGYADQRTGPNTIPSSRTSAKISEKYFWLPPQPTFKSPLEANYPVPPPVSPTVLSSLIRLPGENRNSMKTLPHPERAFSPEGDQSRSSAIDENIPQNRVPAQTQNNTSGRSKDGAAPVRPSSPKSRNASRTGRPIARNAPESEQPDLSDMIDRLEAFVRRPGSAMDDHHEHSQEPRQGRPRTPKDRPASRTGRPHLATQLIDDRLVSGSQGTLPLTASPSIFSDTTARSKSEVPVGNRSTSRKTGEPGTIRPCPRAGTRSRNRSITTADTGHSRSRSGSATQPSGDRVAYIEPDETRTMVWSELSKIVGEVLDRPGSQNGSRGRQRVTSRSISASPSVADRATRSENRGVHSVPHSGRRVVSQDRHGGIRSQPLGSAVSRNTAAGASTGPNSPYNPDDEIVAEIIFHDRGCPTHSQRQTPGTGNPTPSQATNPASPPSATQRNNSRQGQERRSRPSQRGDMPQLPRKASFPQKPSVGRPPSRQSAHGERSTFRAPAPLKTMSRFNSNASCPTLDGASIHTITSAGGSPATPPSRPFEPTTPKAMKLDPDFGTIVTSVSDPTGSGDFSRLKTLQNELIGIGLERSRSAVW
ncbi:hypothetical protein INS49_014852 [Diaporthe citri]|uniref:uncharacterized protein n=1 Tax=Diaporthe citri TaxID=83186 RepID=UPI001C81A166|nr:uncharacterized protein INS49_014852 [Diaporthe citri]KAG6356976.1 hypothetical protein INS49_014852 [Diaporthe citri]